MAVMDLLMATLVHALAVVVLVRVQVRILRRVILRNVRVVWVPAVVLIALHFR